MKDPLCKVVHQDADLLVVDKPAGLVCHPTKTDEYSSLISRVRLFLGPGSEPRMVNRLDRETSGLVFVAQNPETARRLGKLWETRAVEKTYLAIVHGHFTQPSVLIDAPLGKDIHSPVAIKDCVRPDGVPAQTKVEIIKAWTQTRSGSEARFSLVRVTPMSGRKHQIRIHLQHAGHPIVGDKLYGHDAGCYLRLVEDRVTDEDRQRLILPWQALAAVEVRLAWQGCLCEFRTEPERWFTDFAD